jgi:hypothetical protein
VTRAETGKSAASAQITIGKGHPLPGASVGDSLAAGGRIEAGQCADGGGMCGLRHVRISGPTSLRSSLLPPSRDAELVAFRVEHHDMTKMLTVGLPADGRSPGGNQLGDFRLP